VGSETKKSAASAPKSGANAFSMLMTAKKPEAEPKGGKAASEGASAPKAPARAGGWSDALTPYATHPGTWRLPAFQCTELIDPPSSHRVVVVVVVKSWPRRESAAKYYAPIRRHDRVYL